MTTEQIIGFILTLLIMIFATVGSVLPIFPGTLVVLAAAVAHRVYFGAADSVSTWILLSLAGFVLLSMGIDFVAGMVGARKLGASRRGMIGAVLGGLVGLFFSLPGIVLGPFLGALLLEYWGGRPLKEATQAGVGTLLGLVAGVFGKIACCLLMIMLFVLGVWMS